jgi:hypothetical protein
MVKYTYRLGRIIENKTFLNVRWKAINQHTSNTQLRKMVLGRKG